MEKNILNQFINNIPHFIWWKDLNGVFLGGNNNLMDFIGLDFAKDFVGKTDYDLWNKEEADFFRKIDNEIIATGKPQLNFEECITHPETGKRWLSTSKMPLHDDDDNIIGTIGWFDDITEQKKLEQQVIKAKENRYKKLVDSMSEMVKTVELIYDKEGQVLDYYIREANLSAANFYELEKEQLINHKRSSILKTMDENWLAICSKVDKTGQINPFEFYDAERKIYISGTAWKVANKTVGISFKDITEKKKIQESEARALQKLQRIQHELDEAQKLAHVGSWLFDPSTKKSSWSDEMYQIWGFNEIDSVPTYNLCLDRIHADDLASYKRAVTKAYKEGISYDIEYRVQIPNEEQKTIRSICKPALDSKGKVIKLTGSNQDISAQKLFEEVQVKNQRLKAIGEMSSSIAHDFNNSLQEMSGNLEIIKLQNNLTPANQERLQNISSAIGDVASRVSALQKFGDPQQDSEQSVLIDFNELIESNLTQSRPLWKDSMEKNGLHVVVTTDYGEIPKIRCNHGELKSAIYNLIKNSVEAMPDGGEITIKTGTSSEGVYASFTDTGIGMNDEVKLNVFQPFYSTKGFELGRGLGMSGAYSSIKKYGGEIKVKNSEINKGTTFEIVFPFSEPEEVETNTGAAGETTKRCNVLWVDDDKLITDTVKELVLSFGHACTVANDGIQALEYLNEEYDIVFTDIGMPKMNGWELVQAIRQKYKNEIQIVMVSGWSITDEEKAKNEIDFVLNKPFLLEDLEEVFLTAQEMREVSV